MLVLSRRSKQKISFPEVGITVHFIRVQSGTAKVGIDAPPQIKIVRDEARPDQAKEGESVRQQLRRLPKGVRHDIRNRLHEIGVGLHLYKEQMLLDLRDDAEETLGIVRDSLKCLDELDIIRSDSSRQRKAILLVEDQDNERELLAGLLRLKGFEVNVAADGQAALDYLESNDTPSAILMDMNLPKRSGSSAVQEIRSDSRHCHSKVFAISGTSPEENGLQNGADGVDEWFPKPVNIDQLLDTLDRHSFEMSVGEMV